MQTQNLAEQSIEKLIEALLTIKIDEKKLELFIDHQWALSAARTERIINSASKNLTAFKKENAEEIEKWKTFQALFTALNRKLETQSEHSLPEVIASSPLLKKDSNQKLTPLEFLDQYEQIVKEKLDSLAQNKTEEISRARGKTTPEPTRKKEKVKKRSKTTSQGSTHSPEEPEELPPDLHFYNYRLEQLFDQGKRPLKAAKLIQDFNANFEAINQKALTKKEITASDLSKIGLSLSTEEIKELNKINKQIYYHSEILNPVLAQMLRGIYLKAISGETTQIIITKINQSLTSDERLDQSQLAALFRKIHFYPNDEQLYAIENANNFIRTGIEGKNLSHSEIRDWVTQNYRDTRYPTSDQLYVPKDVFSERLQQLRTALAPSIIFTADSRKMNQKLLMDLRTALIDRLKSKAISSGVDPNIILKFIRESNLEQNIWDWIYDNKFSLKTATDFKLPLQSITDLIDIIDWSKIPVEKPDELRDDLLEFSYKVFEENLTKFSFSEFKKPQDNEFAYLTLIEFFRAPFDISPEEKSLIRMALSSISLRPNELTNLTKLFTKKDGEFLQSLVKNPNVTITEKKTIVKKLKEMGVTDRILNDLLFKSVIFQLELKQKKLLTSFKAIKDKMPEETYNGLIEGMKIELEKLRNIPDEKTQNQLIERFREHGFAEATTPALYLVESKMTTVQNHEANIILVQANITEAFKYVSDFIESITKLLNTLQDENGNITAKNLRREIVDEATGKIKHVAFDITPEQKRQLESYLRPFSMLTTNILGSAIPPNDPKAAYEMIITAYEKHPDFYASLKDASASFEEFRRFLTENNIIYMLDKYAVITNGGLRQDIPLDANLSQFDPTKVEEKVAKVIDYTIKPMQFFTKIPLLLRDAKKLLKKIPENEELTQLVREGRNKLKEDSKKFNDSAKKREEISIHSVEQTNQSYLEATQKTLASLLERLDDLTKNSPNPEEARTHLKNALTELAKNKGDAGFIYIVKIAFETLSESQTPQEMMDYLQQTLLEHGDIKRLKRRAGVGIATQSGINRPSPIKEIHQLIDALEKAGAKKQIEQPTISLVTENPTSMEESGERRPSRPRPINPNYGRRTLNIPEKAEPIARPTTLDATQPNTTTKSTKVETPYMGIPKRTSFLGNAKPIQRNENTPSPASITPDNNTFTTETSSPTAPQITTTPKVVQVPSVHYAPLRKPPETVTPVSPSSPQTADNNTLTTETPSPTGPQITTTPKVVQATHYARLPKPPETVTPVSPSSPQTADNNTLTTETSPPTVPVNAADTANETLPPPLEDIADNNTLTTETSTTVPVTEEPEKSDSLSEDSFTPLPFVEEENNSTTSFENLSPTITSSEGARSDSLFASLPNQQEPAPPTAVNTTDTTNENVTNPQETLPIFGEENKKTPDWNHIIHLNNELQSSCSRIMYYLRVMEESCLYDAEIQKQKQQSYVKPKFYFEKSPISVTQNSIFSHSTQTEPHSTPTPPKTPEQKK